MARWLPTRWLPRRAALLPAAPTDYHGPLLPFWFAVALLVAITARSLIHLFAPDGGAHSIATIDLSVSGGANIVALFGQWGAIQLLLAALMWTLLLRYRGLLPLILATLLVEPFLRALTGHLKPLTTVGAAPGAVHNWTLVPLIAAMLYLALCPGEAAAKE